MKKPFVTAAVLILSISLIGCAYKTHNQWYGYDTKH